MAALGVETIIYTDISRDGVLTGVNAAATAELARGTGLHVIASGGVADLEDVRRITAVRASGIGGVIIGRALYDGESIWLRPWTWPVKHTQHKEDPC